MKNNKEITRVKFYLIFLELNKLILPNVMKNN